MCIQEQPLLTEPCLAGRPFALAPELKVILQRAFPNTEERNWRDLLATKTFAFLMFLSFCSFLCEFTNVQKLRTHLGSKEGEREGVDFCMLMKL